MVKLILALFCTISNFILVEMKHDIEKIKYQNVFENVSLYSSLKGIEVIEDENIEARFNEKLINYYFHVGWEAICNTTPKKLSVVTFDSLNIEDNAIYGTSVQIKIEIESSLNLLKYEIQYDLSIKGGLINEN